jgi:dTDP-4-dehydrorhamnose reductase
MPAPPMTPNLVPGGGDPAVALVLGADGQLGSAFAKALRSTCRVVAVDVPSVDICAAAEVSEIVRRSRPSTIFNCAAWNGVDQAEYRPLDALYTNAFAVRTLAALATEVGATLVHFSTDFVFDGRASTPYGEFDAPGPLSVYGMSKLLGDYAAATTPLHYVLRLSSLYGGARRTSFVDRIAATLAEGKSISVFRDRMVSLSYVPDVLDATLRLVKNGAPYGLYHCAAANFCSWYDVALEVARRMSADPSSVQPTAFSNQPTGARRPKFCALSTAKLAKAIGPLPGWQDALQRYVKDDSTTG